MSKRFYTTQPRTWREIARPIIEKVLKKHEGEPPENVRKALRDAYPFGTRSHYPYQVWLDEVRRQLEARFVRRSSEKLSVSDTSTEEQYQSFLSFIEECSGGYDG